MGSSLRIYESSRQIFDAQTVLPDCDGSLIIEAEDGSRLSIRENIFKTNIRVRTMTVSGCGCYSVHSRKNGKGAKTTIFESSGTQVKQQIGFGRIRSIFKIDCAVFIG